MKDYTDYEGPEVPNAGEILFWLVVILCGVVGVVTIAQNYLNWRNVAKAQLVEQSGQSTIVGGCDETLWQHTYHAQRLQIAERCASVTGVTVDATRGKQKDGCRHESDGDGHCFLKLDAGFEHYINEMNVKNEGGNLVFEPECRYRVTQLDAVEACANWKQTLKLPPIGTHVRITGAAVLDAQHGHREIHPISSIEMIKGETK